MAAGRCTIVALGAALVSLGIAIAAIRARLPG
jgi:hypothetical protein